MRRWLYFTRLSFFDITRLWSSTQHQIVIIAGICLPILLLLGLKRGHVTELRRELLTSPTGRQVVFWSAQRGDLLSDGTVKVLRNEISGLDVLVPDTQRLVYLHRDSQNSRSDTGSESSVGAKRLAVTLYSTAPGDPILSHSHLDVLEPGELSLVLSESVLEAIGCAVGDRVALELRRRHNNVEESHIIEVMVKGQVPSTEGGGLSGYANIKLLNYFEQYVNGYAVPEIDLPAMQGLSVKDEYDSYLLFCMKGPDTDIQKDDYAYFAERGIVCEEVHDISLKSLYGILQADRLNELAVYRLSQTQGSNDKPTGMRYSPMHIVNNTQALDDFALRWNEPRYFQVEGLDIRLLGLSLPTVAQTGGWLLDYLVPKAPVFSFDASLEQPLSISSFDSERLFQGCEIIEVTLNSRTVVPLDLLLIGHPELIELESNTNSVTLSKNGGSVTNPTVESQSIVSGTIESASSDESPQESLSQQETVARQPSIQSIVDDTEEEDEAVAVLQVTLRSNSDEPTTSKTSEESLSIAIVPANLLAYLNAVDRSDAVFDSSTGIFSPAPRPAVFNKARLYTHTIDDVPLAVRQLGEKGYAVLSESTRIAEIQQQDGSLQLLVYIVAGGVLFFGVITVVSVLVDSTERKRGTIGILRVMGMSPAGVFLVVVVRAVLIGILAAIACLLFGYLLALFLSIDGTTVHPWLSWKPSIQVLLEPQDLSLVALGALACSGIGAVFPALRASRIDPFDAIVEGRFH